MNYFRVIGLFLATIAILAVGLIGFGGCSGNAENTLVIPEFEEPGPPPIEVTVDQLYAEFIADQEAAKAKYKGKRLSFIGVTVEEVSNSLYIETPFEYYIWNSSVKFMPRYLDEIELIRKGFVVDIVGEVKGVFGKSYYYLIVEDCWINIVEGDIWAEYEEPVY